MKLARWAVLILLLWAGLELSMAGGLFVLERLAGIRTKSLSVRSIPDRHRRDLGRILADDLDYLTYSAALGWTIKPGGRGDLYLRVHITPHERFRLKDGGDVELELPIAPWEAVLGGKVEVPTLDGPVEMRIPPNSQGGKTLRLKGKGLALPGGGRGDQYVRLKIVVPPKPTEKEVELLKKLASESAFNARRSWN